MKTTEYKTIEERPMVCSICNSEDISTQLDIGYDVFEAGEERQHLYTCETCKATRFFVYSICEFYNSFLVEEWLEKGKSVYDTN